MEYVIACSLAFGVMFAVYAVLSAVLYIVDRILG